VLRRRAGGYVLKAPSFTVDAPEPSRRQPNRAIKNFGGVGRVLVWRGGSVWVGHDAGMGALHAHHAIQISLALSGSIRLRGERARWIAYQAALVPPHHRHQFDGCGATVAQLFVEPETDHGRVLVRRYHKPTIVDLTSEPIEPIISALRTAYESRVTDAELVETGRQCVNNLTSGAHCDSPIDPRIARAIDQVQARRGAPMSLKEAASVAHLSPSRFRHLFMEQTGISFRAYLLWTRLAAAVGAGMSGTSWTAAAQDWGFADSAHLSRTFRRMFGIAPTMLVREDGVDRHQ
jgi:AraC family transcriptional regulator